VSFRLSRRRRLEDFAEIESRAVDEHHRPAFAKRLAGIEGLRGLAVISVVVFHVWSHTRDAGGSDLGWTGHWVLGNLAHGVTLFFTLSGFLLYLPFVAASLRGQQRPSFGAYLRNRALRILPAYWFILLVVSLVLQSARVHDLDGVGAITDPVLLAKNVLLAQNYSASSAHTGISPAWSLAIEAVFYLLLPALVVLGMTLASRTHTRSARMLALSAPAIFLGVFGLIGTFVAGRVGGLLDVSFVSYAHLFAPGMLLTVVYVEYHDGGIRLPLHWRRASAAMLPVIVVAAVWLGDSRLPERSETILMSIACTLLLALVVLPAQHRTGALAQALECPPIAITGVISYSIYLWHLPLILFLLKHGLIPTGGLGSFAADLVIVAALVGGLSMLTYRFIEKPAMKLKSGRRESRARQPVAPAAASQPAK